MISRIFLEGRLHTSTKDFEKFLIENGIEIEGGVDYYIASGSNGDAYKVKEKPRVIKVEFDWGRKTYEIYEKIREANKLNHIVEVYYNKLVKNYLVTVMEYLEPVDEHIMPESSWYILLHMEDIYHSGEYKKVNEFSVYRIIEDRMQDVFPEGMISDAKKIFEEIMDTYKSGDDVLMRILVHQLLEVWIFPKDYKYLEVLKDVRDNPKLFKSVFDGILEFEQLGIKHGDVHFDNILKDPKTGNIKLIDPFTG